MCEGLKILKVMGGEPWKTTKINIFFVIFKFCLQLYAKPKKGPQRYPLTSGVTMRVSKTVRVRVTKCEIEHKSERLRK